MRLGLIVDLFLPFHRGHEHLIRAAAAGSERLTILVCSGPGDPIPGWARYAWLKNTFPGLDVRHLIRGQLAAPGSASDLTDPAWLEQIGRQLPAGAGKLFSANPADAALARALQLQLQLVAPETIAWPRHPEAILQSPQQHWADIPAEARPYFIRRVALVGPESCGKSVLAEKLAERFETVFVEEYGRTYCEKFGMNLTELDFAHIAGGQLYREDECAKQANGILFCDTELIVTQVWSEIFFGGVCQPWILWANHLRRYDLFLLLAPDIPWINDGLREFESQRNRMFERLQAELLARALPHVVVRGDYAARTAAAIEAVEQRLYRNKGS